MIRHLFKLIWNRKKSNFLLIAEIFFCFLVLFGVLSLVVYNVRNYNKPLGYTYDDVWLLSMQPQGDSAALNRQSLEQVLQRVQAFPEVQSAALTRPNVPFAFSQATDQVSYGQVKNLQVNFFEVQDKYKDVLQLPLKQGRWFGPQDDASHYTPVVINTMLKQKLFGEETALGKVIQVYDSSNYQVVGVVEHFRPQSEYAAEDYAIFTRINLAKDKNGFWNCILIRVKPGTGVGFEEKMVRSLSGIAKNWTLEVATLEKMRQNKEKVTLVPMLALGLVCGFLIFNVALGLFGVLWYNISRRHGEIGLRRALGAAASQIYWQFIGEVLVLTTFGLLLGVFFAVQFPLLQVLQVEPGVYLTALVAAAGIIYLLTAVCAFYPSRQAAAIQPATALHEE